MKDQEQEIDFGLLAHCDLSKFQNFIKNYWYKDHIFAHEGSLFDWEHKGTKDYHCIVAKQKGELIGVFPVIPLNHFDKHLPKNQIFTSLIAVIEEKGIGIGLRLVNFFRKEYQPMFVAAIGINSNMVPFHKWQKCKVGKMSHHVILSPYLKEFVIAKVPASLKLKSRKKKIPVFFKEINENDLISLDTKGLYSHQCPVKSNRYIINRFMKHPMYHYAVYALLKDDKVQAICIIRPIVIDESVVLRFVDFIGPNEVFLLIHDFALDLLKRYKAEYLDIYTHGVPHKLIEKGGFLNRGKIKNLIIPNHFEPFERKNVDIMYAYKNLIPFTSVRLFKADGDQDRPSQTWRK